VARKSKDVENTTNDDNILEYFRKELGSVEKEKVENFISTGSTLLDYAIANRKDGGVPVGRITEIIGNEGSGKSLLAYHIMANTQKRGGIAVYIDTEHAYNEEFMKRMGVDTNKNFIMPERVPGSIEEVFDYIEKVILVTRQKFPNKEKLVTVVWDSVAATPGKDDIELSHTENARMATEARALSRSLRKATEALVSGYITLVCVNQIREKVGVVFGNPETTPGGKALPFYASTRIKLSSHKQIKDTETARTLGIATQAKVFKNKVGPNHRTVDFPLYFDWGVNDEISWLDFMNEMEMIKTGGPYKTLILGDKEYKFQGTAGWC